MMSIRQLFFLPFLYQHTSDANTPKKNHTSLDLLTIFSIHSQQINVKNLLIRERLSVNQQHQ